MRHPGQGVVLQPGGLLLGHAFIPPLHGLSINQPGIMLDRASHVVWPLVILSLLGMPIMTLGQQNSLVWLAWRSCRAMTDDTKRLACYDHMAEFNVALSDSQATSMESSSAFGRPRRQAQEYLSSRLNKDLKELDGHTLLPLDNGQVWQQVDGAKIAFRSHRPIVHIRSGLLGSYLMHIGGLNRAIRVHRLQ
jgi:hypothetical protein